MINIRNAIREHLLQAVPDLKDVCEPHVAESGKETPYAVIRQGIDTDESNWLGFRRMIEIWPYVDRTSFVKVDSIQKVIIDVLHGQIIANQQTGEVFSCLYLGSASEDIVDEEWGVITRGLSFSVVALQPVKEEQGNEMDPWVSSIAKWSQSLLGDHWTVYENYLPMGYKRPALLWRLKSSSMEGVNRSMFEVKKELIGHVLGLSNTEESLAVATIVEEAIMAIKIPLYIEEKRYLTVMKPRGDFQADSLNSGQISLPLKRKTSRPKEEFVVIKSIQGSGEMR